MQNKKLLIILCVALVALLAILGIVAVVLLSDGSEADNIYQQQLDLGNSYLQNNDYDQAIAAFRAAISADPYSENAYYQLAIIYLDLVRMDEMKAVLLEGIERTSSARLRDLYVQHFGELTTDNSSDDKKESEDEDQQFYISDTMTTIIANYTYKDYTANYASPSIQAAGQYKVTFASLDADLYFFDKDGNTSIDEGKGKPYDTVRPNYIVFGDLSHIFGGLESSLSISTSTIKNLDGVFGFKTLYDTELSNYIQFVYNHTVFEIATDSNDSFNRYSEHRIYSEFGTSTGEVDTKFKNTIKVISATTGRGVADADVKVYENANTQVDTFKTDSNGNAELELKPGTYTVKVECEDYVTEEFDFEVFSTGMCSETEFVISPELEAGQIRIVLEWGDQPRDLDSYLVDSTGRTRVSYTDRKWTVDGRVVAELDVDDRDGYGPETITIYDTSIDFTYFVHDFHTTGSMFTRNDVSVKVYTDNGYDNFTLPTSTDTANGWCVFSYINRNVILRNYSVPERSDFRHYN